MPQLESQVVFWKLLQAGYIELIADGGDEPDTEAIPLGGPEPPA